MQLQIGRTEGALAQEEEQGSGELGRETVRRLGGRESVRPTGTRPRYRVCSTHGPFSGARPQCALDWLLLDPLLFRLLDAYLDLERQRGGSWHLIRFSEALSAAIPGRLVCSCSDLCGRKDFYLFVGGSSSRTNFFMYVVWRFPFSRCSNFSVLHAGFIGF